MQPLNPTSAQRRYLKQLAHHLKPLVQMGKDGPTKAFMGQVLDQIDAHELIKLRILNNCENTKAEIEAPFHAEGITVVQKVGHVYTLFRQKEEDSRFQLPRK